MFSRSPECSEILTLTSSKKKTQCFRDLMEFSEFSTNICFYLFISKAIPEQNCTQNSIPDMVSIAIERLHKTFTQFLINFLSPDCIDSIAINNMIVS